MRSLVTILVMAVVLFPLTASATIINIPGDYATIQEGIDAGSDGDTVLVQPDIYYQNLNFNAHNVVLASLFLLTGDTSYVSSTIIDRSQSGPVVIFSSGEDSTAQVVGFTIQNGNAWNGGGIYCASSSPTIRSNAISGNRAQWGGGIYCRNSNSTISGNTISNNLAFGEYAGGGGIFCSYSNPTISGNTISNNATSGHLVSAGGGIVCSGGSATISGNAISNNSATTAGGGIYCPGSSATISGNTISNNSAGAGGGIVCGFYSSPEIINNTISGNSAVYGGGGIYCDYYSSPTITNTILWGDTAPASPEIGADTSSSPLISYCNIQDTLWPGSGNIDEDPIFVGPYNEDFCLRWRSPCIDAGDPDPQYNDPDGTRNDMGAFYFNQAVLGVVEVYPHDEPIVIPPEGGDVTYDGGIWNLARGPLTIDIYAYAFVPGWTERYRLWRHRDVTIPAADSIVRSGLTEHVPDIAPAGDYVFVTYIGDYPSTIIDSSCFYFTKAGAIAGGMADWESLKGWFEGEFLSTESGLPTHYTLSQNYPNPFNTTTTINYQLPVDGHVKLEVYNTLGQKVATLVDEKQKPGYRLVNWDALEVSSGLYFYKLTAGDYTQTRRMMLVR